MEKLFESLTILSEYLSWLSVIFRVSHGRNNILTSVYLSRLKLSFSSKIGEANRISKQKFMEFNFFSDIEAFLHLRCPLLKIFWCVPTANKLR